MSSKILLGGTFVVFVIVIGVAYFTLPQSTDTTLGSNTTASTTDTSTIATTTGSTNTTPTPSTYTLADVAKHANASSCWAAINGNVYDLTKWINQHPGGPEHILAICGTDASTAFNQQHGGQPQPANELKNFLLGPLSK